MNAPFLNVDLSEKSTSIHFIEKAKFGSVITMVVEFLNENNINKYYYIS